MKRRDVIKSALAVPATMAFTGIGEQANAKPLAPSSASLAATAKHDFIVPELPPPPSPVKDPPTAQNWMWRHHNDYVNNIENRPDEFDPYPPEPLTDPVTSENPLRVDVCDSIRSCYSYLVVDRLAYLRSNYNVEVAFHVIFPVAVNSPGLFFWCRSRQSGTTPGPGRLQGGWPMV